MAGTPSAFNIGDFSLGQPKRSKDNNLAMAYRFGKISATQDLKSAELAKQEQNIQLRSLDMIQKSQMLNNMLQAMSANQQAFNSAPVPALPGVGAPAGGPPPLPIGMMEGAGGEPSGVPPSDFQGEPPVAQNQLMPVMG